MMVPRLTVRSILVPILVFGVGFGANSSITASNLPEPSLTSYVEPVNPLFAPEGVVRVRSFVEIPNEDVTVLVSQGTGIVVNENGFIITNNHVIGDGDRFEVTPADGRQFWATVIARDTVLDIAVLQLLSGYLHPLAVGNSDTVTIGQEVTAIGFSPQRATGPSLRSGMITTLDSGFAFGDLEYHGLIATDLALFPGASGGPLFDSQARVVGINTAIVTPRVGRADVSYSIPINQVRTVVLDLVGPVLTPEVVSIAYTHSEAPCEDIQAGI